MRKYRFAVVAAAALSLTLAAIGIAAASTMLDPFTQTELDTNWEADRQFPSGGVTSVSAQGRDSVAQIGIDTSKTADNTFRRTEGIKTVEGGDFGQAVQVDLYVDPDWQETAVRAGFWVVGDDGAGNRDDVFGIIEYVNLEPSTSGESVEGDHTGWRIWDSSSGWTNVDAPVAYGEWVTLTITLDPDAEQYSYAVNGTEIGTAAGGPHFIRELFLNSYNYGLDTFPNLGTSDYTPHWHAGSTEVDERDQCKDGNWEQAEFRNQGQCIRFVNTGSDTR